MTLPASAMPNTGQATLDNPQLTTSARPFITMTTRQRHFRQSVIEPTEMTDKDWLFSATDDPANGWNWRPGNAVQSDLNYFDENEPYKKFKNSMFNPLTGQEPIYGHIDFSLNPLKQEQTNAHMSGYQKQKISRIQDNMDPFKYMNNPPLTYPVTLPINVYKGSRSRPPMP